MMELQVVKSTEEEIKNNFRATKKKKGISGISWPPQTNPHLQYLVRVWEAHLSVCMCVRNKNNCSQIGRVRGLSDSRLGSKKR